MLIDVIIQMFEWSWDSIAAECTNFIGPAGMSSSICSDDHVIKLFLGYGFIQASPAQETITGQSTILAYKSILSDIFIEKWPMVDGLPAGFLYTHRKTGRSQSIPEYDQYLSCGRCQSYCGWVRTGAYFEILLLILYYDTKTQYLITWQERTQVRYIQLTKTRKLPLTSFPSK